MSNKKYLESVKHYLVQTYGEVRPEWMAVIQMLAYNLELLDACTKSVQENGIYDKNSGKKNPLLSTIKDLQATILKQVQHLGLSPYAVSKIRLAESDDTDDFINSLVN